MQTGIIYQKTGQRTRGQVQNYHGKPYPLKLNKTPFRVDVSGLKAVEQRTAIEFDGSDFESKFTIGFEVEKNQLSRGAVREYELFCGFERDGSCGYEAVTHILPLLPAGMWRTKVFDMMHKAEKIIDDRFSPSDRRCGGHITIGVQGLSGDELREKIRGNCGIIYALFKGRLSNSYCNHNQRMHESGLYYRKYANGYHHKYAVALVKDNCLEFRIPSKFESVKQMMRRYELMYEVVNFSINNPSGSHDTLLKRVRPIVLSMYNGEVDKVDDIMKLAKHFRNFILKNDVHQDISAYVSPSDEI